MGAIHHQLVTLADVARTRGSVHLGRVVSVVPPGRELVLEVRQTWPPPPPPPPVPWWRRLTGRVPDPPSPLRRFVLAEDTAWTDPHVSPVHLGLADGRRQVAAGEEVLLVEGIPVEALPATPRHLETVALAFDAQARATYAGGPLERLVADLGSADRFDLALSALRETGRLSAGPILAGYDGGQLRGVLRLVDQLTPAEREALATGALPWLCANRDRRGGRLPLLLDRAIWHWAALSDRHLELLGQAASELQWRDQEERRALHAVHATLVRLVEAGRPAAGWERAAAMVLMEVELDEGAAARVLTGFAPGARAEVLRHLHAALTQDGAGMDRGRARRVRQLLDSLSA